MLGYTVRWQVLRKPWFTGLVWLCIVLHVQAWAQTPASLPPTQSKQLHDKAPKEQPPEQSFVLVGAGEQIPGTVFAAGDLAYESGSAADFRNCYDPTWGRFRARKPTLGNHEYGDPTAKGYFDYWGAQAGPVTRVIKVTNCYAKKLGGCGEG